jgi:opacity protein-like surface antigen
LVLLVACAEQAMKPFSMMNRSTLINWIVSRFLIATTFLSAPALRAGSDTLDDPKDSKSIPPAEIKPWCETPSPLEIRIGIPGWIAGLSGDTGAKGVVSNIDVGFEELFKRLTHVPIVLSADIRYKRWELFGDGQYMEVGDSATLPGLLFTNASVHVKSGLAEGFLGYRLINCNKAALSLFAGARYSYEGVSVSIFDNGDARLPILRQLLGLPKKLNPEGSIDWVDPVIGARGKVKLWKATSLYVEGDVGGFDANSGSAFDVHREGRTVVKTPISSSDWSYQVQGGLEFQLSRWFWTQVGWRYLKYDYVSEGFTNKTALNGPFVQGGVNF